MRKLLFLRTLFLIVSLVSLFPQLWIAGRVRAADADPATIQIENRDYADASFSCDVKLSGGRYPGRVFAVLFAESGQMKRLSDYPAGESVKVTLRNVDEKDYIKILWTDENYMPLASSAVLRMSANDAQAYEDFAKRLASLRRYEGASGSADENQPYALARLLVSCAELPDLSRYAGKVTTVSGPENLHILQFYNPAEAEDCATYLKSCPSVRYVEADAVTMANGTEDAETSYQPRSWGVSLTGIGEYAENLRQRGLNGSVIVAVVDSGAEASHPLLQGRLVDGYDFVEYDNIPQDEHGHGAHVAGTVADCTHNMDVKIMPVRVLDAFAYGSYSNIAQGIYYAANHGANIINLSLGSKKHMQTVDDAINYALSKNVTVIVAAGNYNGNVEYFCPAHIGDCVTVAAVDADLKRFELSNYGDAVDIAAPGVKVNSSKPHGTYGEMTGTSMAAPHVSAAAALLMSERGTGQTPFQIASLLRAAATDLGEPGNDAYFGAGFLNMRPFIRRSLYAILYADGELVFQKSDTPEPGRARVGIYPVAASGDSGAQYAPWYERRNDIKAVTFAEPVKPASTALWFYGCENLTQVRGLANLDTSEVTDMSKMFARCASLTTLDLSPLDTRNVESVNAMCFFCEKLTKADLTGWDTKSLTDTRDMFMACAALETVYASDSFTTESVTESAGMFGVCTALIGGNGTRYDAAHTDKAYARIDGGVFAPGYFSDKNALKPNPEPEPTPAPSTDIYAILYGDGELVFQNNNRTEFGRGVTDIYKVDKGYSWDALLKSPSTPWYERCDYITTVTFADKIQPVSTAYWFAFCENLTDIRRIENLDTSKVTDMRGMFGDCKNLTELDLRGLNTSNVEHMGWERDNANTHWIHGMFSLCSGLQKLNVSGWNTGKVKAMGLMFQGCSCLESLDISGWNTRNVTSMCSMFSGCSKLTELDLRDFDTSNVIYMEDMFFGCNALKAIYADNSFVTESVSNSDGMFRDCASLIGGAGTACSSVHTDGRYARIDGGASAPGYFTRKA